MNRPNALPPILMITIAAFHVTSTPVVSCAKSTPVVFSVKSTLVVFSVSSTPVVFSRKSTPVVFSGKSTPVVSTPVVFSVNSTPVVFSVQSTPVVFSVRSTPGVFGVQSTPVVFSVSRGFFQGGLLTSGTSVHRLISTALPRENITSANLDARLSWRNRWVLTHAIKSQHYSTSWWADGRRATSWPPVY